MTDFNRRDLFTGSRQDKAPQEATALPGTFQMRLLSRDYTIGAGVPMGGYGWDERYTDGTSSVRKPKMQCVVLRGSAGGSPVVLVRIDVVSIPRHVYEDLLRKLVDTKIVASAAHLVIAQSHTHYGPMVGSTPDPYVLINSKTAVDKTNAYTVTFVNEVVNLVRDTMSQPVTDVKLGYAEGLANTTHNREGLSWVLPEVQVLLARRVSDGVPQAVLFGHACHPVCGANHLGGPPDSDFCGQAAAQIEKTLAIPALFFQGAAGDLEPNETTGDRVVAIGTQVADAVISMVRGNAFTPVTGPVLVTIETIQLPFAVDTGNAAVRADLLAKYAARRDAPTNNDAEAAAKRHAERMLEAPTLPTSVAMTVQRLSLGGLSILTLSHEVLSGYHVGAQARFKARSTTKLWIMAYANHVDCYVAADDKLQVGGYAAGWNDDPGMVGVTTTGVSYSLPAPLKPSPPGQSGAAGATEALVNGAINRALGI
jgi:neutral ceramidase